MVDRAPLQLHAQNTQGASWNDTRTIIRTGKVSGKGWEERINKSMLDSTPTAVQE